MSRLPTVLVLISLLLVGCGDPRIKRVGVGISKTPAELARITNAGNAVLVAVDSRRVNWMTWDEQVLRNELTYELSPGAHRLRIALAVGNGASDKQGEYQDFSVELVAGRTYLIAAQSRLANSVRTWSCKLIDTSTGQPVGTSVPPEPLKVDESSGRGATFGVLNPGTIR